MGHIILDDTMAPFYLFLVLIIQSSLTLADNEEVHKPEETTPDVVTGIPNIDSLTEIKNINKDWLNIALMPADMNLFPSSSVAMMTQMTELDQPDEEKVENIKDMANKISLAIQSEMANLLRFALKDCDKDLEENSLRKKRSAENPMDSSQLVMRLLRHIKSNNEYQNVAIDKMMTAQEIADKYGIEFNPDPEILTDLATAANDQVKEMSSILNDVLKINNITQDAVEFVPVEQKYTENPTKTDAYYVYSVNVPEEEIIAQYNTLPHHEYYPEIIQNVPQNMNHHQYDHQPHQNYYYPESQIVSPPVHQHYNPVSQMPNFYEPFTFFPGQEYHPQYSPIEPITTTTTIVLPIEEIVEPEPILVGEEYEETVTSKVYVDHGDEPGSSTVNHVMTYTISEKSHFKTPEVEKLPQQMQYYFFLM